MLVSLLLIAIVFAIVGLTTAAKFFLWIALCLVIAAFIL